MIRAEYIRREMRIRVTGHAGYAPNGQDIVCAGASTLFHTLIAALEEESRKHGDKVLYNHAQVRYVGGDYNADRVWLIMDTVWRGFELLADSYGDYITAEKTG